MLYKNAKLDLLTKCPKENLFNNIKLDSVNLHITNNNLINNQKIIYSLINQGMSISGQLPQIQYAKKSNSAFNIKKGMPISIILSLRKIKANIFIKKFIYTILPQFSTIFSGNYIFNKNLLIGGIGIEKIKVWQEIILIKNENLGGLSLEIKIKGLKNLRKNFLFMFFTNNI